VAAVGGAGAWYALTRPGIAISNVNPTPDPNIAKVEPTPDVPPNVAPDTSPVTPDTPPVPSRKDMLSKAVAEAKALEAKQAWADAVAAYVKIAQDFPESEAGKVNLEAVCGTLRARPDGFPPDIFARIRTPMTDAAQLGIVSAMMVLAENLRRPVPEESYQWFFKAGELGDPEGLTQAGLMAASGLGTEKSIERAVELFQKASDKGHPSAQAALGECLLRGKGVTKDETAAVALLQKGVSGGNARAMVLLSDCYKDGLGGLEKDPKEAARLLDLAVQNDDTKAMVILGGYYMRGFGVTQNDRRGFDLFRRGAAKGDRDAMYLLAYCYEIGAGTPKNPQLMREFYQKAAGLGNEKAIEWCKKNKVEFTPTEPAPN
jgi:TPR repeat protein